MLWLKLCSIINLRQKRIVPQLLNYPYRPLTYVSLKLSCGVYILFHLIFAFCSGIMHVGTVRHALLLGKGFLLLPLLTHLLLQVLMPTHPPATNATQMSHRSMHFIACPRIRRIVLITWQVLSNLVCFYFILFSFSILS